MALLADLRNALQASNSARDATSLVNHNQEIQVQAGTFLMDADEVGELMVGVFNGKPVFLKRRSRGKR